MSDLISEIYAAAKAGDHPRMERAAYALRTRFGVSVAEPNARTHFSPYRPAEDKP